jgi:tetratricopeptide (TPR) repeat protein
VSLLFKIYAILKGGPPPEPPEEWYRPSGMRKFGFWGPLGCLIIAGLLHLFLPQWQEEPQYKYDEPSPYWEFALVAVATNAGIALFVFVKNNRWLDVLYLLVSYAAFGCLIAAYVLMPRAGRIALAVTGAAAASGWGVFTGIRRLRRTRDARDRVTTALEMLKHGHTRKALAHLDVAVREDERNALAWLARGTALGNVGRDDEAIADLTNAIDLEPGSLLALRSRGILYAAQGRCDEAITDFSRAIAEHPDESSLYILRGGACIDRGAYDRAWADAKRAERLRDPNARHLLQKLRFLPPGHNPSAGS